MVIVFLEWVYILLISFLSGHFLIYVVNKKFFRDGNETVHFSLIVFTGFSLLAFLATLSNLFIRLDYEVNLFILLISMVYLAFNFKKIRGDLGHYLGSIQNVHLLAIAFVVLAFMLSLILSASGNTKYDDGLYYIQNIKWMQHYKAIKGLGNLHLKFSFNSLWHILSALFGFTFLFGRTLNDLNGLFHFLLVIFALEGFNRITHKDFRFSNFFRTLLIIPLHLQYIDLFCPAMDLIAAYLCWIVLTLFIEKIEQNKVYETDLRVFFMLLFSVFAITVKLSAAPIIIIPGILIIVSLFRRFIKKGVILMLFSLIFITPWIARNIIVSGYLVYPVYQLDFFNVDWKVPKELIKIEVIETKGFSKIKKMKYAEVENLNYSQWLPFWFKKLRAGEKFVLALDLLATIFLTGYFIVLFFKKRNVSSQFTGKIILVLVIYIGIAFWFFTAPAIRYGLVFLVPVYLILFSWIFRQISKSLNYRILSFLIFVFILVFYSKVIIGSFPITEKVLSHYILFPPPLRVADTKVMEAKNFMENVPVASAQCWNAPLPCAPFVIKGLEKRGDKFTDGFKISNPDPKLYEEKRLKSMHINWIKVE